MIHAPDAYRAKRVRVNRRWASFCRGVAPIFGGRFHEYAARFDKLADFWEAR